MLDGQKASALYLPEPGIAVKYNDTICIFLDIIQVVHVDAPSIAGNL